MPRLSFSTQRLQGWLDRIQAGDASAQDELLRHAGNRLERLARKMLSRFPGVRRWAETGDVLQNASLRLLHALKVVRPANTRDFFALAAQQIRRELLDLLRHFHRRQGHGANHASQADDKASRAEGCEPPDRADDPDDLERWCAFHEAVEQLPAVEREVIGLIFYHGWTQEQIGQLFGVDERTVRRHWRAARLKLQGALKGDLPTLSD
jgi:RNA polymerase sigma-70 factor (ECF subfamily)